MGVDIYSYSGTLVPLKRVLDLLAENNLPEILKRVEDECRTNADFHNAFGTVEFHSELTVSKLKARLYDAVKSILLADLGDGSDFGIRTIDSDSGSSADSLLSLIQGLMPRKFGYADSQGKPLLDSPIEEVGRFSEGLAPTMRHGLWGYINQQRQWVIPPRFDCAGRFSNGMAPASGDGRWGLVDENAQWIIAANGQVDKLTDSFNEVIAVRQGLAWGFIDTQAQRIIEPQFESEPEFREGLASVERHGQWGFIDKTGVWVIPPQFKEVVWFEGGLCQASNEDGLYGFIDKTGAWVIAPQFEVILGFGEDLCAVQRDEQYGFINKTGAWVIPPQFTEVGRFAEGVCLAMHDGQWGFIDKTGTWVIPPQTEELNYFEFQEGLCAANKGHGWGFVDKTGAWVISPQFEAVGNFTEGLCPAMRENAAGLGFNEGLCAAKQDGRWGFIDKTGAWVIAPQFQRADSFFYGLAHVEQDGRSGYIDKQGTLLPRADLFATDDLQNDSPVQSLVYPNIRSIIAFTNPSWTGAWDCEPEEPYVVFDVGDCFVQRLTAQGRALEKLLGHVELKVQQWSRYSC